jgi:hypothetical protein
LESYLIIPMSLGQDMFSAATHVDRTVHQNYRVRSVLDPGTSLL